MHDDIKPSKELLSSLATSVAESYRLTLTPRGRSADPSCVRAARRQVAIALDRQVFAYCRKNPVIDSDELKNIIAELKSKAEAAVKQRFLETDVAPHVIFLMASGGMFYSVPSRLLSHRGAYAQ